MLTKIKFPDFIFNSPVHTEDVTLIVMNLNVTFNLLLTCHILEFQNYKIINFFFKFLKNYNISDFVSLTFQILH